MNQSFITFYQSFALVQQLKFEKNFDFTKSIQDSDRTPLQLIELAYKIYEERFDQITYNHYSIVATSIRDNVIMVVIPALWLKIQDFIKNKSDADVAFGQFVETTHKYPFDNINEVQTHETKFSEIWHEFSEYLPDFGTTAADIVLARDNTSVFASKKYSIDELLAVMKYIILGFIDKGENETDNDTIYDDDYTQEIKLCPKCGSILDEDYWCNECLEFAFDDDDFL